VPQFRAFPEYAPNGEQVFQVIQDFAVVGCFRRGTYDTTVTIGFVVRDELLQAIALFGVGDAFGN